MYWLTNKNFRVYRTGYLRVVHFGAVCALVAFTACTPPNRNGRPLFAVDSLLHGQASTLIRIDAALDKHITLGTKQEELTVKPRDATAWLKELEVFSIIDAINKPINRERYKVTESADTRSNLRVRSFSTSDDLPVSYVNLYYYDRPSRIRKIEALYAELNGLYKTSRLLTLDFIDLDGAPVMSAYTIVGGQKMFMDDSVEYTIKGRVRFGKIDKNGKAEY